MCVCVCVCVCCCCCCCCLFVFLFLRLFCSVGWFLLLFFDIWKDKARTANCFFHVVLKCDTQTVLFYDANYGKTPVCLPLLQHFSRNLVNHDDVEIQGLWRKRIRLLDLVSTISNVPLPDGRRLATTDYNVSVRHIHWLWCVSTPQPLTIMCQYATTTDYNVSVRHNHWI